MLVLSRKLNERIVVDGNIEVVILSVHGDRVKLGFEAPQDIPIHRAEVQRKLTAEAAAGFDAPSRVAGAAGRRTS
jgi:carbon storage regulator